MIEHMVLFKVKPATPVVATEKMLEELKGLRTQIPAILELTCGTNTSDRSQGFTHGLLVRFRSKADLDAYIPHPEHQRVVAEYVRPIIESVIVVDYET